MPTGEMPNPQEIVGFHFEGECFCRDCYGGKNTSGAITFAIAWMNKKMACCICKKRLCEVPK